MRPLVKWLVVLTLAATLSVVVFVALRHRYTDWVKVEAATATVYLTGTRSGACFCLIQPVSGRSRVGNVTGGPSHLAALFTDHALHFKPDVEWSELWGETKPVPVGAIPDLSVKFWHLSGPENSRAHLLLASQLFRDRKTGIRLVSRGVTDATSLGITEAGCVSLWYLKEAGRFDPTAVNVYYVERALGTTGSGDAAGMSCSDDRRATFVYAHASDTVMAHELGHSLLGQGHWTATNVSSDNLMLPGDEGRRTHISTGQNVFMSHDQGSVLNRLRKTAGLDCSTVCPALAVDESNPDCKPRSLPRVKPADTAAVIAAWFDCIECDAGELEALLQEPSGRVLQALSLPLVVVAPARRAASPDRTARLQRRALIALAWMSRQKSPEAVLARAALVAADKQNAHYRADVRGVLERAKTIAQMPGPGLKAR